MRNRNLRKVMCTAVLLGVCILASSCSASFSIGNEKKAGKESTFAAASTGAVKETAAEKVTEASKKTAEAPKETTKSAVTPSTSVTESKASVRTETAATAAPQINSETILFKDLSERKYDGCITQNVQCQGYQVTLDRAFQKMESSYSSNTLYGCSVEGKNIFYSLSFEAAGSNYTKPASTYFDNGVQLNKAGQDIIDSINKSSKVQYKFNDAYKVERSDGCPGVRIEATADTDKGKMLSVITCVYGDSGAALTEMDCIAVSGGDISSEEWVGVMLWDKAMDDTIVFTK